jgi:hypothetical protein
MPSKTVDIVAFYQGSLILSMSEEVKENITDERFW